MSQVRRCGARGRGEGTGVDPTWLSFNSPRATFGLFEPELSIPAPVRSRIFVQDFTPGRDTSGSRRPLAGIPSEFTPESLGVSPDGESVVVSAMSERRRLKLAEYVSLHR
jgi:hypothetical protein